MIEYERRSIIKRLKWRRQWWRIHDRYFIIIKVQRKCMRIECSGFNKYFPVMRRYLPPLAAAVAPSSSSCDVGVRGRGHVHSPRWAICCCLCVSILKPFQWTTTHKLLFCNGKCRGAAGVSQLHSYNLQSRGWGICTVNTLLRSTVHVH